MLFAFFGVISEVRRAVSIDPREALTRAGRPTVRDGARDWKHFAVA